MKELSALLSGIETVKNKAVLSIIIPTYNEEANVIPLTDELSSVLSRMGLEYEIIFVDDGSRDKTYQRLQLLHTRDCRVKIIKFRRNFGQSAAMAAGFDYALGDVIITLDADLQNDPADIPDLLKELDKGYDVVCGWRYNRKDTVPKKLFSKISNWLRRRFTSEPIHDSGCSLRAYKKECFHDLELYGEMHRYIPAILSWKGYRIGEIKAMHRPRAKGQTKYNWKRLPRGFLDLLIVTFWQRYAMRPIHIFGGIGLLLSLAGIGLGIYLSFEKLIGGQGIGDRPILLLAVLMLIVGIQFIVFGVLADIMIRIYYGQHERKSYTVERFLG
jgi:glycosyltransferase involved in cell wall biosynthesis